MSTPPPREDFEYLLTKSNTITDIGITVASYELGELFYSAEIASVCNVANSVVKRAIDDFEILKMIKRVGRPREIEPGRLVLPEECQANLSYYNRIYFEREPSNRWQVFRLLALTERGLTSSFPRDLEVPPVPIDPGQTEPRIA